MRVFRKGVSVELESIQEERKCCIEDGGKRGFNKVRFENYFRIFY